MRVFILITVGWLTLTLISSCSRKVSESISVVSASDSSVVENSDDVVRETLRIDTVYVKGETTVIEIPIPTGCDSLLQELNALKDSDRSRVSVSKIAGRSAIRVQADCKEFETVIVGKDIEIKKLRELMSKSSSSTETKESETIVVYRPSWFHKMFMWNAIILDTLLLLYLLWTAFKGYLKTQFPFLRFIP